MEYLNNGIYCKDIEATIRHTIGFRCFEGKRVLVLGASGLIGSFITDCLIYANEKLRAGMTVYAASRNRKRLQRRFGDRKNLQFLEADVTTMEIDGAFDYIIHAASYGHPGAFREMPVEVLLSNVVGAQRALELARTSSGCRILYVSSGEAQEKIDCMTSRACYPVGKRAAETLCVSYWKEYGVDAVIARPSHVFGANATENDNRATAQFISSAARGVNIQMYSAGEQMRSFTYVADCASGLLTVLARGENGVAYGISAGENCTVRDFAEKCAGIAKCSVEFHTPTEREKVEASPFTGQIVKNDDLRKLGWYPAFTIDKGIENSVKILRDINRPDQEKTQS